jgi:hypothetical protein
MKGRIAILFVSTASLAGTTGCVERVLQVRSDPPGATVYVNGTEAGKTPLDHPFTFYGTVEVALRREGVLYHREFKELSCPWYDHFPVDFFTELLVPWTIRDVHLVEVRLSPSSRTFDETERKDLRQKAEELRGQAGHGP